MIRRLFQIPPRVQYPSRRLQQPTHWLHRSRFLTLARKLRLRYFATEVQVNRFLLGEGMIFLERR